MADTHLAWDSGVINNALDAVFYPGAHKHIAAKTTKTKCGRTVPSAQIDNRHFRCASCQAVVNHENEQVRIMQSILDSRKGR